MNKGRCEIAANALIYVIICYFHNLCINELALYFLVLAVTQIQFYPARNIIIMQAYKDNDNGIDKKIPLHQCKGILLKSIFYQIGKNNTEGMAGLVLLITHITHSTAHAATHWRHSFFLFRFVRNYTFSG